jgi:hypothetical protein
MKNYQLENLTPRPLWLRLNSGEHLHISPRSRSPAVAGFLVEPNSQLDKLESLRVIRRIPAPEAGRIPPPAP